MVLSKRHRALKNGPPATLVYTCIGCRQRNVLDSTLDLRCVA